jgi:hypothetical protein
MPGPSGTNTNLIWPSTGDPESATFAFRQGGWAAVVVAAITLLVIANAFTASATSDLQRNPLNLIDAAAFGTVAYLVLMRSVYWAGYAGLALYVLEQIVLISSTSRPASQWVLPVIFFVFFVNGARGASALRRGRFTSAANDWTLNGWRRLWIVVSLAWALLIAGLTSIEPPTTLNEVLITGLVLAIPPAVLYSAGLAIAWVLRGFRESKTPAP